MTGRLKDLMRLAGGEWLVSFTTRINPGKLFDNLHGKDVNIEITKQRPLRSQDANAFCWAMCTDIGNALRPPVPKEEVYRNAIRDVGQYFPVPVRDDLVDEWKKCWARNGTGWFADVTDKSKTPGYTLMFSYRGTSSYDTHEMALVLDYLKMEMDNLGLQIPLSKAEEERLMAKWGGAA